MHHKAVNQWIHHHITILHVIITGVPLANIKKAYQIYDVGFVNNSQFILDLFCGLWSHFAILLAPLRVTTLFIQDISRSYYLNPRVQPFSVFLNNNKIESLLPVMSITPGKGFTVLILACRFSLFRMSGAYSCNGFWQSVDHPESTASSPWYQNLHWHCSTCSLPPCNSSVPKILPNLKPKNIQNLNSFWNYFYEIRIKIVANNL